MSCLLLPWCRPARTRQGAADEFASASIVDILARGDGSLVASVRCLDGRWGCVKAWRRESLVRDGRRLESLRRETAALRDGQVDARFCAAFLEVASDDVGVYLVTELCPGGDLATRRRRLGGRMPASDVALYASDLLAAVEHLVDARLAHRDVKPENCVVAADGRAKLVDFGLSSAVDARGRCVTTCGTPCMCAPEVVDLALSRGDGDRSGSYDGHAADLWSLGCTLMELSLGPLPWDHHAARGATPETAKQALVAVRDSLRAHLSRRRAADEDEPASAFLDLLLVADPKARREAAARARGHPFLAGATDAVRFRPKFPDHRPGGPPARAALLDD